MSLPHIVDINRPPSSCIYRCVKKMGLGFCLWETQGAGAKRVPDVQPAFASQKRNQEAISPWTTPDMRSVGWIWDRWPGDRTGMLILLALGSITVTPKVPIPFFGPKFFQLWSWPWKSLTNWEVSVKMNLCLTFSDCLPSTISSFCKFNCFGKKPGNQFLSFSLFFHLSLPS